MDDTLRILILEDLPTDLDLMLHELREAKLSHVYERVEDEEAFLQALDHFHPHLILSDFHLPQFDGLTALSLAKEKCPAVPFIFVTGAMGEEVAIETLKRGATDYVLKDHLTRLGPAVQRALREAAERQERRQAEAALRESEQKYRILVQTLPAVVYRGYYDCAVDFVDEKVEELTGYKKQDFDCRKLKWTDLVLPDDRPQFLQAFKSALASTKFYSREYRIRRKDGKVPWIQERGQIVCNDTGRVEYVSGVLFDISERKQAEEALRLASIYARSLIEASLDPLVTISAEGKIMDVNRATENATGVSREELIGRDFSDYFTDPDKARQGYRTAFSEGAVRDYPLAIRHRSGRVTDVLYNASIYRNEKGEVQGVFAAARDITERQRAEEALRESEQRLRFLSSQLLSAQERERKRISMELHDELGQSLTVLKLQIRAIEKNLRTDQQDLRRECEDVLRYLDSVIENVRRLSRDLSPAILQDLGLSSALKYLLNGFGKQLEVRQSFEVEDLDQLFSQEAQIIIYRIFQECLHNISKHAQASEVSVTVRNEEGTVSFALQDNGAGFNISEVLAQDATRRGFGLAALHERARMLGGKVLICSERGVGTKVVCQVPLEPDRPQPASEE